MALLSTAETATFISALRNFVRANMPMDQAMTYMSDILPRRRGVWDEIAQGAAAGASLKDLLERHDLISEELRNAIAAGERSGKLGDVLSETVRIQDEILTLKTEVGGKLIMPAIYLLGGFVLTFVYTLFVIPSATSQLHGAQRKGIIAACDAFGHFLRHDWIALMVAVGVLIVAIFAGSRTSAFRIAAFATFVRTPVLGKGIHCLFSAIWIRYACLLDKAGGLEFETIVDGATGVLPLFYRAAFERMRDLAVAGGNLRAGVDLTDTDKSDPRWVWPALLRIGLASAARTGDLNGSLAEIAGALLDQGERTVKRFLGTLNLIVLVVTCLLSVGPMGALFMAQTAQLSALNH